RTIRDEHETEIRPLAACGEEDRALAALILHGHELIDGRAVLHLDERALLAAVRVLKADGEVRREVLAAQAKRWRRAVRGDLVARAAEDRLDQGFGDPTLDLEEIHPTSVTVRSTSRK